MRLSRRTTYVLILLSSMISFLILLIAVPLPKDKLNPPQAYRFYDRTGQIIAVLISQDGFFRMHEKLENINPLFIKTLLTVEDQYFYTHMGINPLSILRAALTNLLSGRIISGASTITMQLARMLKRRRRTVWAKLIEIFRSLQLELRYTKDEILAYYLSLAPYGGNIEGVEAAAFRYFGKSASALSVAEIALLVALPKSPTRYRPDRHPERAHKVRNRVLEKMRAGKLITGEQYHRALAEPIVIKQRRVKNCIPHTAWRYRM